jgi:predicted molibdopterin-dependent oxidoreductase YjgC
MLPKRNPGKDYSVYGMMESAIHGQLKMLYVIGQNPIVTNANLTVTNAGFDALEMLVVQELWETETADFWRRPGVDPKNIKTEVILLPAAYFMEKEGTITGAGRMVQALRCCSASGRRQDRYRNLRHALPEGPRALQGFHRSQGSAHPQSLVELSCEGPF